MGRERDRDSIEDHEFELLGVRDLGTAISTAGMAWHHVPIRDVGIPDGRFHERWQRVGPGLLEILR